MLTFGQEVMAAMILPTLFLLLCTFLAEFGYLFKKYISFFGGFILINREKS